jgi:hypothetical protein
MLKTFLFATLSIAALTTLITPTYATDTWTTSMIAVGGSCTIIMDRIPQPCKGVFIQAISDGSHGYSFVSNDGGIWYNLVSLKKDKHQIDRNNSSLVIDLISLTQTNIMLATKIPGEGECTQNDDDESKIISINCDISDDEGNKFNFSLTDVTEEEQVPNSQLYHPTGRELP